jgi:GTP-binding protein Era
MMKFVESAFADADVIMFITDIYEVENLEVEWLERINQLEVPLLVLLNKVDLGTQEKVEEQITRLKELMPKAVVVPVSALHSFNLEAVLNQVLEWLPEAPPFYDKDSISDRPVRFFIAEMIRSHIMTNYRREIPYSCEVEIEEYKDEGELVRIRAIIYVARKSQKGILIGHQGKQLKRVGTGARKDMEEFLGQKVFLEMYVKVDENWRDQDRKLDKFGYR